MAEPAFNVTEAGTYRLLGRLAAPEGTSNSFFVTINEQPVNGYLWDLGIDAAYTDDYLSNRNGADPVEVYLTAGEHTITVYLREDGTRLDKLTLEPAIQVTAQAFTRSTISADIEARGILGSLTDMSAYETTDAGGEMRLFTVTLLDEATRGANFQASVMTDASGRFFFDTMPVGAYVIAVEVDGQYLEEPLFAGDDQMEEVVFGLGREELGGPAADGFAADEIQNRLFIPFFGQD